MQTGENEQALRKILDMTRMIAIVLLALHFYYYLYAAFRQWHLVSAFSDRLIKNIQNTGLYSKFHKSKLIALGFLAISLLGAKGRKDEKQTYKTAFAYMLSGLLLYFISYLILFIPWPITTIACAYMLLTGIGFMLALSGGTLLSRIIKDSLQHDIFNSENETFPQEERRLENEYSINLPARYRLKNKVRPSWISIINPFRGILNLGNPGSGKSYFFIRHVITQHISKGFAMFVYDFKMPDLSIIVYNTWLKNKDKYKSKSYCYFINFDDLTRSHRCNALEPSGMLDITDAAESARTILMGLNREWIKKQGDFFVESPINFLTAIIWFLRKYQDGMYCTLPHVIEFMQLDYDSLFTVLRLEKEIDVLINPFVNAYLNDVMEQLEGQIASAKVAMARLSSPQLYYVLSGQDFTLNINNPEEPKLVCMGNNPQKIQIYGAVLSLYVNRLVKLVNQKDKLKSSLIFDEFPTIYLNGIDKDPQGNWYYFQKGDIGHMVYGSNTAPDLAYDYISKWVIQKIIKSDGSQILFNYTVRTTPSGTISYMAFSGIEQNNPTYAPSPSLTSNVDAAVTANQTLKSYSDILSITYPNFTTANFVYINPANGRCDDPGKPIMSEIQILSSGGNIRYVFDQDYAVSLMKGKTYPAGQNPPLPETPLSVCQNIDATFQYDNNYRYHRLLLKGINIVNMDGNKNDPYYSFKYNTAKRLPPKLSGAQDFFGYYNGKELMDDYGGTFNIPYHHTKYGATQVWYGVDKTDDWTYAIADILDTVQNGYGAKTVFAYEAHQLSNVTSDADITLPSDDYFLGANANDGVRLKYILTLDDRYPGKFQRKSFKYLGGQRFIPGGYFDYPVYTINQWSNNSVNTLPNTAFGGTFVSQHQFINGSNHGYSEVIVADTNDLNQQLSRKDIIYQNISRGYHNTSYCKTGTFNYFDIPYTDKQYIKDWELGLPLTTTEYDENNYVLTKVINLYDTIGDYTSAAGKVENIHRLSTSESGVLSTYQSESYRPYTGVALLSQTITQKFVSDDTYISDTTILSYDDHNNLSSTTTQNSLGETFVLKNIYNYNVSGPNVLLGNIPGTLYDMTNDGLEIRVGIERWKKGAILAGYADMLFDASINKYQYQNGKIWTQKLYTLQSSDPIGYTAYTGMSIGSPFSNPYANILNAYNSSNAQLSNFQLESEVLQFDSNNNPLETQMLGQNSYLSMIWDSKAHYKLAEVQNARLADVAATSFEPYTGVSYLHYCIILAYKMNGSSNQNNT